MQSWGTSSRFTERDTASEPSKSGVVGLLCAALGKPRHEDSEQQRHQGLPSLATLASLRMGVRIDKPGTVGVDFQTAGGGKFGSTAYGVARAQGGIFGSVMSYRYFLQDASFLVGLSGGNKELLKRLHQALRNPVWQLSLGRKSYVPGVPPYLPDGLREAGLEEALVEYKPVPDSDALVVLEVPCGARTEPRMDQPVDYARRLFARRYVQVTNVASLARK